MRELVALNPLTLGFSRCYFLKVLVGAAVVCLPARELFHWFSVRKCEIG